jgi:hypothetical protein
LLQPFGIATGDVDLRRALRQKSLGRGEADAGRCAGDEYGLIEEGGRSAT